MNSAQSPESLLLKHWGFPNFRPLQKKAIDAALNGRDTLVVLPTGGGKSICYQIPSLCQNGICIVISPLVALISDQVNSLKKKGIKAIGLTGGMSFEDVSAALDNCIYGNYKFLYLSPERLNQDIVTERIRNMEVNLIAIDEAHCISQWGHDFRPAYRECHRLKELQPGVPVMALTATATPEVATDIRKNLGIEDSDLIKGSFQRPNLAYWIRETEDRYHEINRILKRRKGPSIVYARSRKATIDCSNYLRNNGITAGFFHGGLLAGEKQDRLEAWLSNKIQVMVATTAFGMGIDKPDVETVIHLNYPESLESYYQEAGRAGRNGERAWAILLKAPGDEELLQQQFINALPDTDFIRQLYRKLCNYFQISYGEGTQELFDFNFNDFCHRYEFPSGQAYNALKVLDRNSVIALNENFNLKTELMFICSNHQLFYYLEKNSGIEHICQVLLRSYGGLFDMRTTVNTKLVADKAGTSEAKVIAMLKQLEKDGLIELYIQEHDTRIAFLVPREDDRTINVIARDVKAQQQVVRDKIESVIKYTRNDKVCRSAQLSSYFGEKDANPCGICSVCFEKRKEVPKFEPGEIQRAIIKILGSQEVTSRELHDILPFDLPLLLEAVEELMTEEIIGINIKNEYYLINRKN
ncbi:RecQ family ATP-dependent DNA helicase [Robertkochia solimangrovi]|uniref:RecQ family ATP-dependent DNA helicase n=1 Tax=Robertkochia solimangrovi TaxID=2213046 RepID=UPI001180968A|nr:ATP-dependent DNA helicase RecQ [Robertkochia solimangrovi]TRZ42869.1 RecQ family ATP-dependent DNA helicase [Robertkochia solimangrovi]